MKVMRAFFAAGLLVGTAAVAQTAQEITFFSNVGFSGAQFTVTGPRTTLRLPFEPRSAMLRGGGNWEVCSSRDYGGDCRPIVRNERDLAQQYRRIGSIRPVAGTTSERREVARVQVTDRSDFDTVPVRDGGAFVDVVVCAERNTVRMRNAYAELEGGRSQRLFLPLVLEAGQCSNPIELQGDRPSLRAFRFEYEAWTAGFAGATIIVRAKPYVERQPR
jgi:hypothetical protein